MCVFVVELRGYLYIKVYCSTNYCVLLLWSHSYTSRVNSVDSIFPAPIQVGLSTVTRCRVRTCRIDRHILVIIVQSIH